MSLNHDFLLLDRSTDPVESYGHHIHSSEALLLHDDLIHYMLDALAWVPTENPATQGDGNGMGLNLYGPTVISQRGARKFQEVCSAMAMLFAAGPKTLKLRGLYSWDGDDPASGGYERLSVGRDEVVGKRSNLASWTETAGSSPGAYVLHLGI